MKIEIVMILLFCLIIVLSLLIVINNNGSKKIEQYLHTHTSQPQEPTMNHAMIAKHAQMLKQAGFKYTKPHVTKQLYHLMYITDRIFAKNKIEYWVDSGTLLGVVRHQGLIPWDDDVDIKVWNRDSKRIERTTKEFAKYNVVLMPNMFGYKIFFNDAEEIKGYKWKYPAIDVFVVNLSLDKRKILFSRYDAQRWFGECYNDPNKLYPLKRARFGSFTVSVPSAAECIEFCKRCYGRDWNTHAYAGYDHENEKMVKPQKVVLLESERRPAKPYDLDPNIIKDL